MNGTAGARTETPQRELSVTRSEPAELVTFTAEQVTLQMELIKQVAKNVMEEGADKDFGAPFPGSKKKTLHQSGAQKLGVAFRLAPIVLKEEVIDLPRDHREYRFTIAITHIDTGKVFGHGVGSCTTMESRYRWRKHQVLPKCAKCAENGKEVELHCVMPRGGRREWQCWGSTGGCETVFPFKDHKFGPTEVIENTDPADVWNTCLKLAYKRAHVHGVLIGTAANGVFSQDPAEGPDDNAGQVELAGDPGEERPPGDREVAGESPAHEEVSQQQFAAIHAISARFMFGDKKPERDELLRKNHFLHYVAQNQFFKTTEVDDVSLKNMTSLQAGKLIELLGDSDRRSTALEAFTKFDKQHQWVEGTKKADGKAQKGGGHSGNGPQAKAATGRTDSLGNPLPE